MPDEGITKKLIKMAKDLDKVVQGVKVLVKDTTELIKTKEDKEDENHD